MRCAYRPAKPPTSCSRKASQWDAGSGRKGMRQMVKQDPQDDGRWHLDRKINLGLVIGLVTQAIMFGWWGSKLDSRVGEVEKSIAREERRADDLDVRARAIDSRLVRIEERSTATLEILKDIRSHLSLGARP
jgi:hypothetical protein